MIVAVGVALIDVGDMVILAPFDEKIVGESLVIQDIGERKSRSLTVQPVQQP